MLQDIHERFYAHEVDPEAHTKRRVRSLNYLCKATLHSNVVIFFLARAFPVFVQYNCIDQ